RRVGIRVGAEVVHAVQPIAKIAASENCGSSGGDAACPGLLSLCRANEVLAHLDDRMREPASRAVLPHAIARELAVVGLVLADDDAGLGAQRFEHGYGEAMVPVPQNCSVPR